MSKRHFQALVALGLLLPLLSGCGGRPAETPRDAVHGKPVPPVVSAVRPERQTVRQVIGQPGHIEAFEQTPIYVKISGYVRKVHVDIGDRVMKGRLLAELDVPEMVAELEQKRAALVAKAEEEIKQAREIVKVAEAMFHTAEFKVEEEEAGKIQAQAEYSRWDAEFRKADDQVRRGLLDQQTLDVTRYQRESARASKAKVEAKVQSAKTAVKESQAQWRKAEVDVKVAEARHKAAQSDQAYVAALLNYAHVPAPYDGIVMVRNINTGDFLQPNATGGKGEPLFVVASADFVRMFFEVPETEAVFLAKDAKARIRVRGLKGEELEGKVVRSSWGLNPRERTLRAEINMENKGGRLRPGMYAFATITLEHKDVWTLPAAAVGVAEEQPFCVRVEDGKAVYTPVQLGLGDGKRVEVLKKLVRRPGPGEEGSWEAFSGAEQIISANPGNFKDGQAVNVIPPAK